MPWKGDLDKNLEASKPQMSRGQAFQKKKGNWGNPTLGMPDKPGEDWLHSWVKWEAIRKCYVGRGEKWTKPCMHIWIIKEKWKKKKSKCYVEKCTGPLNPVLLTPKSSALDFALQHCASNLRTQNFMIIVCMY
jgi:hypothetical protein